MDLKDIELFLSFLISRLCQKSKIIAFWNNVWSILQEIKTSSCLWLGDNIIWLSNQCPGQEGSPEVSMITRWMSGLTSMNCNLQIYLSLTFLIFLYMFLGHFCFVKSNNFHYFNYFKKINKQDTLCSASPYMWIWFQHMFSTSLYYCKYFIL